MISVVPSSLPPHVAYFHPSLIFDSIEGEEESKECHTRIFTATES
jgi:hypothetical protein